MLLCQISDPHIVAAGALAYDQVDTASMLDRCVRKVLSLSRLPDAVVVTGDLTDNGTHAAYDQLAKILDPLPMPVFLAMGNHDVRNQLRSAFPQHRYLAGVDGFIQYVVEEFAVRLVVLDTAVEGAAGGVLCERRLAWLDRTLAAAEGPTIVAQHHPPFATGLTAMDGMSLAAPEREAEVIKRYPHVERIICGHYHRNMQARFAGTVASVCPSTAQQLLLDLVPDAKIRFTFEPPSFQLHLWNGSQLVTHTQLVDDFPIWGSRDR